MDPGAMPSPDHRLLACLVVVVREQALDLFTMQHALHYAESGHLCVSTLHANNANQAV